MISPVRAGGLRKRPLLDFFCLHSSAAAFNGGAVLFAGESGAGKSTVVRLLREAGRTVYGDELSVCTCGSDGRWLLQAMASTRDGVLVFDPDHPVVPVVLMVHLGRHLPFGHALHACSPLQSVVLGFRSVIAPGQFDPSVRADRFQVFSRFARAVPATVMDFALDGDFAASLDERAAQAGDERQALAAAEARMPEDLPAAWVCEEVAT